ncbi:TolB family protein [Mycobacterium szulgai]|uniref:Lipoprotein LpqB beta-propeller domain-containing protein n=1 Tax=Mycobacterium szulgai TaxID=1787 RepID=A0A1X2EQ47_MYCSZ|nr:hypothetical protein [Mycobacterium szulgai]MCV7079812.1 hypothetical protein [Mycobacterium szulgai]ORX08235.1 hypothetical protein AWC27_25630 [Mycobacterium szulgai]
MIRHRRRRWVALLAVLALAACDSAGKSRPAAPPPTSMSATTGPTIKPTAALFYTKSGSLYVSQPAGTPGRKLTDGPADTQPAPSPDLSHVAFVRKTAASAYGGELWVLDLSPQLAPVGPPRRLVNPATLPHGTGNSSAMIASPRWSPAGQHIAFIDNTNDGMVDGGLLLLAAADTGALMSTQQRLFAASNFAWAPDGSHIAWAEARSDVRPVSINALTVGGASTPVAIDTNAFSMTYAKDGQSILFANGDVSDSDVDSAPFAVRPGGIYAAAVSSGSGGKPSTPTPLLTKPGSYYSDIAALNSGAVAFTTQGADDKSKAIEVLDKGSSVPRTTVTDVTATAQGPAWSVEDLVAYLDTSPHSGLVVTDPEDRSPRHVDTEVDAFAWAPSPR